MKKNTILAVVVISIVFIASAVVLATSPKQNSTQSHYNEKTYNLMMQDDKPAIMLIYTDWCTYCKRFMPIYEILKDIYKNQYNFVAINADEQKYIKLMNDYSIGSFPTLYIIDPKIDNRVLINNTLYSDVKKIQTELDRYLRIRAMIKS
jgi:thiol-disulfide isomerase/thioredoxin